MKLTVTMNNMNRWFSMRWFWFLFLIPFILDAQPEKNYSTDFEIAKNLDIYVNLFKELNTYYVEPLNPAQLITTSIKEMLKTLDPYTVYYPESDAEEFRFMTTGSYGGIGAVIIGTDSFPLVVDIYKGFPAEKSGLLWGDEILEINGVNALKMKSDEISNLIKGQPGSTVNLKIKRTTTHEVFTKSIQREKIHIDNIPYYGMADEKTAYIRLSAFHQRSADEVKKAFIDLRTKNKELSGLILDLRSNPGGLLVEAVQLVNLFVDKDEEVVYTRGKVEAWNKVYRTLNNALDNQIPLVVLIDKQSASASEIVAGTLQDLDRAVIVGQRSFGKGLVQTTRPLGYNTQLKVTTAKYYIPSGRCIQEIDYAHRDSLGNPVKTSDSLIKVFYTRNGRTVESGRGIKPDIEIKKETFPEIVNLMLNNRLIFDYANRYYFLHDSIESPETFALSDDEFQDFIKFVNSKGELSYKSKTEKTLEKLEKLARKEHYFEVIKKDIDSIRMAIESEKSQEIHKYKNLIKTLLEMEIVKRYYFQEGSIRYDLAHSEEVKKARELLSDMSEYRSILGFQNN